MLNYKQLNALSAFVERMNDALLRTSIEFDPQTGIVSLDGEELGVLVAPPPGDKNPDSGRWSEGFRFEPTND